MTHERIAVNTDTLNKDIGDMKTNLKAIEKATKDMFDSINMLNGMWEGSAHDAFLQAVKSDKQAVDELNQTIGDLLGCFEYAKKQYNNCENSVHQIVQSISV